MTISYSRVNNSFSLRIASKQQTLPAYELAALAASSGWGDVQYLLDTCTQNPECEFPVERNSRVSRPRNARVHAILQ